MSFSVITFIKDSLILIIMLLIVLFLLCILLWYLCLRYNIVSRDKFSVNNPNELEHDKYYNMIKDVLITENENGDKEINIDYSKLENLLNNFKSVNYSPYYDVYRKYKVLISDFINEKEKTSKIKHEQNNNKIISLEDKIQDLRKKIDRRFRTSFLNSNILKLNVYKDNISDSSVNNNNNNDTNNDETNSINALYLKKYMYNGQQLYKVYISDNGLKCLEYSDNGTYKISDCFKNDNNNTSKINKYQLFRLNIINNEEEYMKLVYNPDNRYPENIKLLNYPIIVIMIPVNNNCLNLYNNRISFEPCKFKVTQMFKLNKF